MTTIALIANPAAGNGRGRRALPAARAAFPDALVLETTAPGDEGRLVRDALAAGATTIVGVGGDGTWSNIAGALVAERSDCRLALIAAGTGNDLANNIGAPAADVATTARLVAAGSARRMDVGFVDDRCFINCAGFGFDAAVVAAASSRPWPGGSIHYLVHALAQLVGYPGVDVAIDEGPITPHVLLVVANGARFGGSFHIAPGADIADGLLDVVAVRDASLLDRAWLLAAATRGRHLDRAGVTHRPVTEIRFRFRAPPLYEADGELRQARGRDVAVRCVPAALSVVTAVSAWS